MCSLTKEGPCGRHDRVVDPTNPGQPFWRRGSYYQNNCLMAVRNGHDKPVKFYVSPGGYWLCEDVQYRTLGLPPVDDLAGSFVMLCTLHPEQGTVERVGMWPRLLTDSTREFSRLENCMEIIALATTGLVL